MLLPLSALGLVALLVAALAWYAGRPGPPPARQAELVVDWTRQWRRALDSLDRPLPGDRAARKLGAPARANGQTEARTLTILRS